MGRFRLTGIGVVVAAMAGVTPAIASRINNDIEYQVPPLQLVVGKASAG